MPSKSIFKSKTFWLNILGTAITVASSGVIPAKAAVPTLAVGNVILRLISQDPTHIIPPEDPKLVP